MLVDYEKLLEIEQKQEQEKMEKDRRVLEDICRDSIRKNKSLTEAEKEKYMKDLSFFLYVM